MLPAVVYAGASRSIRCVAGSADGLRHVVSVPRCVAVRRRFRQITPLVEGRRGITPPAGESRHYPAAKSSAVAIFRDRGEGFHDRLVLVRREGEKSIARWDCYPGREGAVSWAHTTPTAWKPRGTCPECRGVFALTTRGTLTPHRRADGRTVRTLQGARVPASCDGAAQKPTDCQTGEPARV